MSSLVKWEGWAKGTQGSKGVIQGSYLLQPVKILDHLRIRTLLKIILNIKVLCKSSFENRTLLKKKIVWKPLEQMLLESDFML